MDSQLRKLAIEIVSVQLAIRRIEQETLLRKAESAAASNHERAAAHSRLVTIQRESRGLEDTLQLLEDENRPPQAEWRRAHDSKKNEIDVRHLCDNEQ